MSVFGRVNTQTRDWLEFCIIHEHYLLPAAIILSLKSPLEEKITEFTKTHANTRMLCLQIQQISRVSLSLCAFVVVVKSPIIPKRALPQANTVATSAPTVPRQPSAAAPSAPIPIGAAAAVTVSMPTPKISCGPVRRPLCRFNGVKPKCRLCCNICGNQATPICIELLLMFPLHCFGPLEMSSSPQ